MQVIKWVILFILAGAFVPESCEAIRPAKSQVVEIVHSESIADQTNSRLNSLVSMLRFNAGDLTESSSHTTFDKKNFIRLFIHLKSDDTHFPEYARNSFIPCKSFFTGPDPKIYYIYILQKLII